MELMSVDLCVKGEKLCHESKLLPAWYKKVTYVDTSFSKLKKSLLETILDFFYQTMKKEHVAFQDTVS